MARLTIKLDGFEFNVRNPDETTVCIEQVGDLEGGVCLPLKTLRRAMNQINKGWKGSAK